MFERSYTLPVTMKSDAVEARCNNGVLTITFPKRKGAKEKVIGVKIK